MGKLQDLLDALPAPLEPLDVSMLDGYLVGVLLQPKAVPAHQWLRPILDSEGRELPPGLQTDPILALCKRRHQQLNRAIAERQWFDPWVFELGDEEADFDDDDDDEGNPSEALLPWVAGFALATEIFPELMRLDAARLLEPLAALYMHLDPDDLEDADDLLEEIESLEPPADLEQAVEALVSACLMLADVSRPQPAPAAGARPPAKRRGPPPPRGGRRH
ncbi:YecA family protein [Roseateles sp. DAIF2]|uniref:YecA/YgfB family protein n=1 Tax=Roseateles sp. DAIF2 TaxID=2714952 RepID=UPI0018A317E9|nr:YecA family protein [Roseateles sp. DAIF2]QPF71714.1 YecA family protein [Roseateles sp. DAIF2]